VLNDSVLLAEALVRDRGRLRDRLKTLIAHAEFREALFLASPDLDESIEVWERDPESTRGRRVERALVRYLMRMAGRAVPFGLFAGCSIGTIGDKTELLLGARSDYQRHTRLDMDYLCALAASLEQSPSVRRTLPHHLNTSLYSGGGRVRYIESRTGEDIRSYHLVAVESASHVETALSLAEGGGTIEEIAKALTEADPSFSFAEAEEFITELIESQLLVSDLTPAVTGPEPIHGLVEKLRRHPETERVADCLQTTQSALEALDAKGLRNSPEDYRAIAGALRELPSPVNLQRLFQTDMIKPATHCTLGPGPLKEIILAVDLLHRMSPAPGLDPLAQFRDAFVERYGEVCGVPLLQALDSDVGIGFSSTLAPVDDNSPVLRGLIFPEHAESTRTWGRRETYLLRKLTFALSRGDQEIILAPDDIEELEQKNTPPLPDAFAAIASIMSPSESELSQGRFRVSVADIHGPSGARLMGRFCHISETLWRSVEQHLSTEMALEPNAIFAEIVHLPAGRTGNVLLRPVLREYEIPYLGCSGAPPERQIPITDLTVTVNNGRIVLYSNRLEREVIPRLTTAHYFAIGGLDVYRFLCLLQGQGRTSVINWEWGPLSTAPFLPRVSFGRIVLAKARWTFDSREVGALTSSAGEEMFAVIQRWRSERALPRFVALVDEENEWPVDLDNVLCVEAFVELIKRRTEVQLVEMLPAPGEQGVRGPEGQFVHQLIIPFVRARRPTPDKSVPPPQSSAKIKRSFPTGSEWLYVKLYAGGSSADHVLRDAVRPLIEEALSSGVADSWFFVRYGDPEWHIRLRLHGRPARLRAMLPELNRVVAPLLADGRLWRVQFDTYQREVERYGGAEGIIRAEKIFHFDSEAVMNIVSSFPGNAGMEARSQLALCSIDALLSDFGLDLKAKRAALEIMQQSFAGEIQVDPTLKRQLGNKYRDERERIAILLDPVRREAEGTFLEGLAALRQRSEQVAPVVAELKELEQTGRLSVPIVGLLASFSHMHVNRILRAAQRTQEFVLYDSLSRFYESQAARERVVQE
jgi:thiopeptide-type bacteriocin biosynthesis protein